MEGVSLQLTGFQARRFKPFADTGWIKIRPITLMFGHNSSGKSALLSILPMLQQTLEDPNPDNPFVFTSEKGVDLGTYDEVAHNHKVSLETPIWFNMELGFLPSLSGHHRRWSFPAALQGLLQELWERQGSIKIEVAANYNKKRRRIALTDFLLRDSEGNRILRTFRKTTAAKQRWHMEPESIREEDLKLIWYHFIPHPGGKPTTEESEYLWDLMYLIYASLHEELRSLTHIGPLRDFPERAYRMTGESPSDVGSTGRHWLNIFLQARPRKEIATQVNYWLERLGYTLRIEWGRQGYVHPRLKDSAGLENSLKDIGFGISQILPVLVQGFSSPPGTMLILEQPEIHLHPRAQGELGDMLLAIAERGIRMLVETHSEHLLLRLRRRLAESQLGKKKTPSLSPEDMAIYFIERLKWESKVHEVAIGEQGEFVDPPDRFQSFFSDDYEEAVKISKAVAQIGQETDDACSD